MVSMGAVKFDSCIGKRIMYIYSLFHLVSLQNKWTSSLPQFSIKNKKIFTHPVQLSIGSGVVTSIKHSFLFLLSFQIHFENQKSGYTGALKWQTPAFQEYVTADHHNPQLVRQAHSPLASGDNAYNMNPGAYSCSECQKTFQSKSGLRHHMKHHTGEAQVPLIF